MAAMYEGSPTDDKAQKMVSLKTGINVKTFEQVNRRAQCLGDDRIFHFIS